MRARTTGLLLSLLNFVVGVVVTLLSLRMVLKLFGASTAAPFVRWVYETSHALIYPFLGMFPSPELTGGFVIEFSVLFALLAYMFLGYLLEEAVITLAYYSGLRTGSGEGKRRK